MIRRSFVAPRPQLATYAARTTAHGARVMTAFGARVMTAFGARVATAFGSLVAIATALGACALSFPEYALESESAASTSSAGGTTTTSTSGGAGGEAGSTGSSALLVDGAPCGVGSECASGHCLDSDAPEGTICCATDCTDEGVQSCGTNGRCAVDGGSCAKVPDGTVCGGPSVCDGSTLTSVRCVSGSCEPVVEPCPGGLRCLDESTCKTLCDMPLKDCANPTAKCEGMLCVLAAGKPCSANDQCESGACGVAGIGHCCATDAPCGNDPLCGATDCDAQGACVYPALDKPCGDEAGAQCEGSTLTVEYCNGLGQCSTEAQAATCPGSFACRSATTCYTNCGSNDAFGDARCAAGFWCDGEGCVPVGMLGAACNRPTQCVSNNCAGFLCGI